MLNSITIKNFKAITELTLNDLASVNYLVGKNGCGKSSVLEGLHIKYNLLDYWFLIYSEIEKNSKDNIETKLKSDFEIEKCSLINNLNIFFRSDDFNQSHYTISTWLNSMCNFPLNYFQFILQGKSSDEKFKTELRKIISKICSEIPELNKLFNIEINSEFVYTDFSHPEFESFLFNRNSSGKKSIFELFILIYLQSLSSTGIKTTIICIEEPENSLNPELQKLFPKIINFFRFNKNIQFIISTHSPFIISAAANLDNQKVYLIKDGETVDIYGNKSSEESKVGYEDGNFILAANKMLGAGLSDLIPTKLIFCESSLAEFIKSFCKQNKITVPSFVTGGGDTNTIDRGQVWKSIYSSLNQYNKDKILDIKMHIIIDDNPQVKDKIILFEEQYPNELCILKADEQEKLFWDIKKEKFIEFLQSVKLSEWDYKIDNQVTFDKFLKLNNQISNKGKLKCDLGEHMGKQFTPDDFKQFSPELHNIIFNQNI